MKPRASNLIVLAYSTKKFDKNNGLFQFPLVRLRGRQFSLLALQGTGLAYPIRLRVCRTVGRWVTLIIDNWSYYGDNLSAGAKPLLDLSPFKA